jgi:hypothetical protein
VRWYLDRGDCQLAAGTLANGSEAETVTLARSVAVGSNLYFIIDDGGGNGNDACDSAGVAPNIHT